MSTTKLERLIILHEGEMLTPYPCPSGKMTWGVGRNYEDIGFSTEELTMLLEEGPTRKFSRFCLQNDIRRVVGELKENICFFDKLDAVRQSTLIDLCFNVGLSKFLRWKNMLGYMKVDYELAAYELIHDRNGELNAYYRQTKSRAKRLHTMILHGQWPNELGKD